MLKDATLAAHTSLAPGVVGKLHLNGSNYLIISLGAEDDPSQQISIAASVEILRFQVSGQLCVVVESVKSESSFDPIEVDLADILTERELQIATLVAMGHLNKQIADRLHISEWTVSTHLRRIFAKLGVRSRAAMVYRCAPLIEVSKFRPNVG